MTWRPARALLVFRDEVDALAPHRSTLSDGMLGDPAHASRASDHNPNAAGVVRAIDITHDPKRGADCNVLARDVAALLGRHPALGSGAYVIWNARIISTDRLGEGWRRYSGANPHDHHMHVSVATKASGYDNTTPWLEDDDMTPEQEALLKQAATDSARAVARGQVNTRLILRVADQLGVKIDDVKALLEDEG